METILVTGGTGLIGTHLCRRLEERGYGIALLSRRKNSSDEYKTFLWDPDKDEIDPESIDTADYIIHLAGVNIGEKRWTSEQKRLIIDSRVKSANLLFKQISRKGKPLKAFLSSSAVGYYGKAPLDKIFYESDPAGNDFLSKVCEQWERAADRFQEIGIRTVKLRAGVVLTKSGGVLEQMKMPVKMGMGSPLGSGKQYVPWIHIEDLCSIYIKAVENFGMNGCYNAVAPDPKTNAEFVHLIAEVLNKPFFFPPVPSFLLNMVLGEKASIVLSGNRVSGEKIINEGFNFKYPELKAALKNLLD